jgi:hypothetical protein
LVALRGAHHALTDFARLNRRVQGTNVTTPSVNVCERVCGRMDAREPDLIQLIVFPTTGVTPRAARPEAE